jgi:hypothetical protein
VLPTVAKADFGTAEASAGRVTLAMADLRRRRRFIIHGSGSGHI